MSLTKFMWEDGQGEFHAPAQMSTRHLFYTVKMLWNHIVPAELRLIPFKQYKLRPPRFNNEYCKTAVSELYKELMSRDDYWQYLNQLNQMKKKLQEWQISNMKEVRIE